MIIDIKHTVILKLNPEEIFRLSNGKCVYLPQATIDELQNADEINIMGAPTCLN